VVQGGNAALESPARRTSIFASLRVRNYRLYAIGQTVSVAGTWMQNIALGWFTLQLTHSGIVLGVVTGARWLPVLLLGSWGGLVADRMDRWRLLAATQVVQALLATLLAVLAGTGLLTLGAMIVLVVALGMASVFENPARQSIISELVEPQLLANAIALNSTLINVAKLAGPSLAGVIIAWVGVTPCFAINAISYAAVIASLIAMHRSEMLIARREIKAPGQIREGLRYVLRAPDLLSPMLMVTVTGILTWEFPVTVPLLTSGTFHADAVAYGIATACMSVGAVGGGLAAARRVSITVRSLAMSAIIWGALVAAAALALSLIVALAALVLVGASSVTFNASAKTLLQLGSAPQMRGRVMALWSIAWQGGTVIGAPVVGLVAVTAGPRYALLVGAAAAAGVGAIALLLRRPAPSTDPDG
jgi:MFS family permease